LIGFGDPLLGRDAPHSQASARSIVFPEAESIHANLAPLPDTRVELTAMARAIHATEAPIYFGAEATEAHVKSVDLARYRIVVFATHGLLRDDERGVTEPALVLSKDTNNDGLLTSSEITELEMDADWVILSACNTAASDGSPRGEGLSGLARAFFFAGARALLVSHWEVDSTATVLLTTGALEAYAADEQRRRAHALRQSAHRLASGELGAQYTHPIYWAPFVVVGEGGRA
jgi:CHAT domain-containing protein